MATTKYNARNRARHPSQFNDRENRASTHNWEAMDVDASYTLSDDDSANFIRGTAAGITVTLPTAARNKGRTIRFYSTVAAGLTVVAAGTDTLDSWTQPLGAGAWAEIFCTGSGWIAVGGGVLL